MMPRSQTATVRSVAAAGEVSALGIEGQRIDAAAMAGEVDPRGRRGGRGTRRRSAPAGCRRPVRGRWGRKRARRSGLRPRWSPAGVAPSRPQGSYRSARRSQAAPGRQRASAPRRGCSAGRGRRWRASVRRGSAPGSARGSRATSRASGCGPPPVPGRGPGSSYRPDRVGYRPVPGPSAARRATRRGVHARGLLRGVPRARGRPGSVLRARGRPARRGVSHGRRWAVEEDSAASGSGADPARTRARPGSALAAPGTASGRPESGPWRRGG